MQEQHEKHKKREKQGTAGRNRCAGNVVRGNKGSRWRPR